MELVYAEYANDMKSLGNRARVEIANTGKIAYSKEAKQKYQNEVTSLENKLTNALKNTPKERQALRLANAEIVEKKKADPNMKKEDLKKTSQRAVSKARQEVGSVTRRDRILYKIDGELYQTKIQEDHLDQPSYWMIICFLSR